LDGGRAFGLGFAISPACIPGRGPCAASRCGALSQNGLDGFNRNALNAGARDPAKAGGKQSALHTTANRGT